MVEIVHVCFPEVAVGDSVFMPGALAREISKTSNEFLG